MFSSSIAPDRLHDCLAVTAQCLDLQPIEIAPQQGGLFNYVLRVETKEGTYFFKQYLDDVPNPIFDMPKIPATDRSRLAYEAQRHASETMGAPVVPEIVLFDRARCALLMTKAAGDRPLNDCLSHGEWPPAFLQRLPQVLAGLHQSSFGRFEADSIFGNTEFRDFKLALQYDGVAARLGSTEAARVLECKRRYQSATKCVTHGDLNSRNIMTAESALGVIDFEQTHLGTPAYDLSYILCELLISMEAFGAGARAAAAIGVFLDAYFERFDAASRESVEEELTAHLAIQTLYRFWGPSRHSWTFYVDEPSRERTLGRARALLVQDGPVTALLDA